MIRTSNLDFLVTTICKVALMRDSVINVLSRLLGGTAGESIELFLGNTKVVVMNDNLISRYPLSLSTILFSKSNLLQDAVDIDLNCWKLQGFVENCTKMHFSQPSVSATDVMYHNQAASEIY
jgi:hypothetical protein